MTSPWSGELVSLTRPYGCAVCISTPATGRAAQCVCMLLDDTITLEFFVGAHGTRETWRPPAQVSPAKILPDIIEISRRIAVHLNADPTR